MSGRIMRRSPEGFKAITMNLSSLQKEFKEKLQQKANLEKKLADLGPKIRFLELEITRISLLPKNAAIEEQRPTIDTTQAARRLEVEPRSVQRFVQNYVDKVTGKKQLPGFRAPNGRYRVYADAIDEFKRSHQ